MQDVADFRTLLVERVLAAASRYQRGAFPEYPYALPPAVRRNPRRRGRELLRRFGEWARAHTRGVRSANEEAALDRLEAVAPDVDGLARTWSLLADEASRDLLLELIAFRAWGPRHVSLAGGAAANRRAVAEVARRLRRVRATRPVSDPHVAALDLFTLPRPSGELTLHSNASVVQQTFVREQYAYRDHEQVVAARAGDTVIDGGACWGDTALYFADAVGSNGRVHAFEFSRENLSVVADNLALNPQLAARVDVVEAALWDRSGEVLEFDERGALTSLDPASEGGGGRASTVTLDDWAQATAIEAIDFVKLDVEGAELRVLRGAVGSLRRWRPTLAIAVYHERSHLVEIPGYLADLDLDYRFWLGHYTPTNDETVLFARVTG